MSRDYTRNPWIFTIRPRMIGYVYINNATGIAVSNETVTMLVGDILMLYKYYNGCVYVYVYVIWESPPLAESN